MRAIRTAGGGAGVLDGEVRRRENSGGKLSPVNSPRVSTTLGQIDWRASSDQCLRRGKNGGRGKSKGDEGGIGKRR